MYGSLKMSTPSTTDADELVESSSDAKACQPPRNRDVTEKSESASLIVVEL